MDDQPEKESSSIRMMGCLHIVLITIFSKSGDLKEWVSQRLGMNGMVEEGLISQDLCKLDLLVCRSDEERK